ncbi:MAG: M23 family metallopeptidase [Bacillota bacterium]
MAKFIRSIVEGRSTSLYGKDTLNGESRDHFGVDFSQSGTVNVVAVAIGIVSRSYTSYSYGECVRIIHQVDGKQWESLHAHMRSGSRKVKDGDKVKQGELLGIMGNTSILNSISPLGNLIKDTCLIHLNI